MFSNLVDFRLALLKRRVLFESSFCSSFDDLRANGLNKANRWIPTGEDEESFSYSLFSGTCNSSPGLIKAEVRSFVVKLVFSVRHLDFLFYLFPFDRWKKLNLESFPFLHRFSSFLWVRSFVRLKKKMLKFSTFRFDEKRSSSFFTPFGSGRWGSTGVVGAHRYIDSRINLFLKWRIESNSFLFVERIGFYVIVKRKLKTSIWLKIRKISFLCRKNSSVQRRKSMFFSLFICCCRDDFLTKKKEEKIRRRADGKFSDFVFFSFSRRAIFLSSFYFLCVAIERRKKNLASKSNISSFII